MKSTTASTPRRKRKCRRHRKSYKTMTKIAINNDTNEVEIVRVGATYNVDNTRHPFYMKVKFKD